MSSIAPVSDQLRTVQVSAPPPNSIVADFKTRFRMTLRLLIGFPEKNPRSSTVLIWLMAKSVWGRWEVLQNDAPGERIAWPARNNPGCCLLWWGFT